VNKSILRKTYLKFEGTFLAAKGIYSTPKWITAHQNGLK